MSAGLGGAGGRPRSSSGPSSRRSFRQVGSSRSSPRSSRPSSRRLRTGLRRGALRPLGSPPYPAPPGGRQLPMRCVRPRRAGGRKSPDLRFNGV